MRRLSRERAIKIAIEVIKGQRPSIRKLAFDANMFDRGITPTATAQNASRDRAQLLEVIGILSTIMDEKEQPHE